MSNDRPEVVDFPLHLVELVLIQRRQARLDLLTHEYEACTRALSDLVKYLRLLVSLFVIQVLNRLFKTHIIEEELRLEDL